MRRSRSLRFGCQRGIDDLFCLLSGPKVLSRSLCVVIVAIVAIVVSVVIVVIVVIAVIVVIVVSVVSVVNVVIVVIEVIQSQLNLSLNQ